MAPLESGRRTMLSSPLRTLGQCPEDSDNVHSTETRNSFGRGTTAAGDDVECLKDRDVEDDPAESVHPARPQMRDYSQLTMRYSGLQWDCGIASNSLDGFRVLV